MDKGEVFRGFRERTGRAARQHATSPDGGAGYRYETDGESYLRQWGNEVASRSDGRVTLTDCGYRTVTTKALLCELLPRGWVLYSDRGVWWIAQGNTYRDAARWAWPGSVTYSESEPNESLAAFLGAHADNGKADRELTRKAKAWADEILRRMGSGSLSDDGGECWLISMFGQGAATRASCVTCEAAGHPRKCGGGSRLVLLAVRSAGYGPAWFWQHLREVPSDDPNAPGHVPDWAAIAADKRKAQELRRLLSRLFAKILRGQEVRPTADNRWDPAPAHA